MSASAFFDQLLRSIGLRTLNHQFLFSYALMFAMAFVASVALYLSLSVSPETINVAGAQRMLSQKMTKEALLIRQGQLDMATLEATMAQFDQAHRDLLSGNEQRKVAVLATPEIRAQMQKVGDLWQAFRGPLLQAAGGDSAVDMKQLGKQSVDLLREMNMAVGLMSVHVERWQRSQMLLAFGCLLGILLLVVLGRQFGLRPLMQSLREVEDSLTRVGSGDFTKTLMGKLSDNEIGRIFAGYNRMQAQVRELLGEVKVSGERTAEDVQGVVGAANVAGDGVRQQHEDIEQVATAMNEMSATVAQVARHAAEAAQSARHADSCVQQGLGVIQQGADEVSRLASQLIHSSEQVQRLEQESNGVGRVLEVITGIAEQTNLLALNAAIEAARAGEAGRGFAVVADEVRTLASRTQQSTGEIQAMIQRLQSGARDAVVAMQQSAALAEGNLTNIREATDVLGTIAGAVDSINVMNAQIATASEQQSQVAQDIDQRITHIAGLAQRTQEEVEQVVGVSTMIQGEVLRLNQQLERFST